MAPARSKEQQRFFGSELGRAEAGKKTRTGLSKQKLREFASKPIKRRKITKKRNRKKATL